MFACNSLARAQASAAAAAVGGAEFFSSLFPILLIGHLTKIYYGNSVRAGKRRRNGKKSN